MNEKIKKLAQEHFLYDKYDSDGYSYECPHYELDEEELEKFVADIVKECANIADDHNDKVEGVTLGVGRAIKQHFGVV